MTVNFSNIAKIVHGYNNANKPWGALTVEIPTDIGRTYAGYKRGGVLEGAEKFRKEVMAAFVWIAGIPAFKKLGDYICEKFLKIPMAIDFSKDDINLGNTNIKDTVKYLTCSTQIEADEFLKEQAQNGKFFDVSDLPKRYFENGKSIFAGVNPETLAKNVKNAKIVTSILALCLNAFALGVALPLINQALTRKKLDKIKEEQTKNTPKFDSFTEFKNKTKKSDNISFKGLKDIVMDSPAIFTDLIENSNTFRLVAPDAPMMFGRVKTSRNKYEAIENLIIDGSGVFLYNFCAGVFQKLFRKISKNSSIEPTISEIIANKDISTIKDAINALNNSKEGVLPAQELFGKETAEEIYKIATYGKYGKINKYIKNETLKDIDARICEFLKKLSETKPDITKEDILNFTMKTNKNNAIFLAIGLLIAIIGQAIVVPKAAFKVTEILTGKNQFTGIADYGEENKKLF